MTSLYPATDDQIRLVADDSVRGLLQELTQSQRRHVYAVDVDGITASIGAVNIVRKGIALAWLLQVDTHGIPRDKALQVIREFKRQLTRVAKDNKIFRIQATTVSGKIREARFMELLGFQQEGTLRKYGPGKEDHIMWSIV